MNKNVFVTVTGLHTSSAGEDDRIESKIPGTYILRNGVHYIKYTEKAISEPGAPGGNGANHDGADTDVLLKIAPGQLEVTRSGLTRTHMTFINNQDSRAEYETPFGMMKLDVYAVSVSTWIGEQEIRVRAGYSLEADGEKISDAVIDVRVEEGN